MLDENDRVIGVAHSPRVNFRDRFNSIASVPDKNLKWQTILAGPMALKCGAILHPLSSREALGEEAEAMAHCVWSYSHSCMAYGYHIFSVRDKNGTRLSTLSVADYIDRETGQRNIRLVQNAAFRNNTAPPLAQQAEKEIIQAVNTGTFKPDWAAVDQSKAGYQAQILANSVGYDFESEPLRDEILKLYGPCLPRHLSRHSHSFKAFAGAIHAEAIVARTLSI